MSDPEISLIVSVLSPVQSCLTETHRSLDKKLVPPIRPSFLVTLETLHLGKQFRQKVAGIALAQRQDW